METREVFSVYTKEDKKRKRITEERDIVALITSDGVRIDPSATCELEFDRSVEDMEKEGKKCKSDLSTPSKIDDVVTKEGEHITNLSKSRDIVAIITKEGERITDLSTPIDLSKPYELKLEDVDAFEFNYNLLTSTGFGHNDDWYTIDQVMEGKCPWYSPEQCEADMFRGYMTVATAQGSR